MIYFYKNQIRKRFNVDVISGLELAKLHLPDLIELQIIKVVILEINDFRLSVCFLPVDVTLEARPLSIAISITNLQISSITLFHQSISLQPGHAMIIPQSRNTLISSVFQLYLVSST